VSGGNDSSIGDAGKHAGEDVDEDARGSRATQKPGEGAGLSERLPELKRIALECRKAKGGGGGGEDE
jgi:hypothetical protein